MQSTAGVARELDEMLGAIDPYVLQKGFEDYQLGLTSIGYGDKIEVVEAYLPDSEITSQKPPCF